MQSVRERASAPDTRDTTVYAAITHAESDLEQLWRQDAEHDGPAFATDTVEGVDGEGETGFREMRAESRLEYLLSQLEKMKTTTVKLIESNAAAAKAKLRKAFSAEQQLAIYHQCEHQCGRLRT